jgi:hypothetical protein
MDEKTSAGLKRTAELCAIFMIGNGLVGALQPKRRVELWTSDVPAIDAFVKADRARSPAKQRAIGLLQAGAGLLLASRLR